MNTKLLLLTMVFCALLSTFSSGTALFFAMNKQSDYQRLNERVSAIEAELLGFRQARENHGSRVAEPTAENTILFQKLRAHEESLGELVRQLSQRVPPIADEN